MHSEEPSSSLFIASTWYDLNLTLVQHDNGSHKSLFIPLQTKESNGTGYHPLRIGLYVPVIPQPCLYPIVLEADKGVQYILLS